MNHFRNSILLCTILILTGCAAKQKTFVAMPKTVQTEIESTDLYLVDCPNKLEFDIKQSNISTYTGGGLIFGLIDAAVMSSRKSDGEKAIGCIQEKFKNINIQNMLHEKLIPLLQNTEWLKTRHVHHIKDFNTEKCKELCDSSEADSTLVSLIHYKLSPDFKTLIGTLYLTLYPTSQKLKTLVKAQDPAKTPIFKTHVSVSEALPNGKGDIKENAKLWSQEDGASLKKSMENLIQKLILNLKNVLKHPQHSPED